MIVVAGKNNIAAYALKRLVKEFERDSIVAVPNKIGDGKDYCLLHQDRSMFNFLISNGADVNILNFKAMRLVNYLSLYERKFFGMEV